MPFTVLFRRFQAPRLLAAVLILTFSVSLQAAGEPTPGPALWKVEGGKADLYLFGTFHLLPSNLEWKNKTISAAIEASSTLVTEADASEEADLGGLIKKYAFNPEGKTLRSYFTEEEATTIDTAIAPFGLSVDGAAKFKPWFVALQVGMTAMLNLGFAPDSGVESVLLLDAAQQPMSLAYLESAEAGILALADHPDHLQAKMLLATVNDLGHIEEMMGQMIEAWSVGDVAIVAQLLNSSMAQTPELIEAVLYKRNRAWIAPLTELLESDSSYFVAVGAGHLAGDNSVIDLLDKAGYTLSRQ